MTAMLKFHGFRVIKAEHHGDVIMLLAVHLHSLASTISENVPSCNWVSYTSETPVAYTINHVYFRIGLVRHKCVQRLYTCIHAMMLPQYNLLANVFFPVPFNQIHYYLGHCWIIGYVSSETKMYVCTLEEFILVEIWIHCCTSWNWITLEKCWFIYTCNKGLRNVRIALRSQLTSES